MHTRPRAPCPRRAQASPREPPAPATPQPGRLLLAPDHRPPLVGIKLARARSMWANAAPAVTTSASAATMVSRSRTTDGYRLLNAALAPGVPIKAFCGCIVARRPREPARSGRCFLAHRDPPTVG